MGNSPSTTCTCCQRTICRAHHASSEIGERYGESNEAYTGEITHPTNESSMQTTEVAEVACAQQMTQTDRVDCSDEAAQTSCIVRTDETTQTTADKENNVEPGERTEVAEVACAQQMTQTDRVDCSDEAAQTSCIVRTDETTQTTAENNVEPGERTGHRPEAKIQNGCQGPYVTYINKPGTVNIQGGASQVGDENERLEQLRKEVKTTDKLKRLRTQLTELRNEFQRSRREASASQRLSGNTQSLDPEEVRIRLDREFSVLKSQISGLMEELSTLENRLREERQRLEVLKEQDQEKQEHSSDDEQNTGRKQVDSDDEQNTGRKQVDSDDEQNTGRKQVDSDDEQNTGRKQVDSDDEQNTGRKQVDSDDEQNTGRKQVDSHDEQNTGRKQVDSDGKQNTGRKQVDSDGKQNTGMKQDDCQTMPIGTGKDSKEPWITSMVVDVESGGVFMVDNTNDRILTLTISLLQVVNETKLRLKPWAVALLSDQHVLAVTSSHEKSMFLIDIEDSNTPVKEVKTLRRYLGVAAGSEGNLVVSCIQDGDGKASVDIITLEGKPVRTVLSAQTLPELKKPRYLCVQGSKAFVSDSKSDCVFCLDLDQGRLTDTLTHPQLKKPFQVCTDSAGNLYVASSRGVCVLKKRTNALAFEPRVDVRHQALVDLETPRCVSVTDTQLLVTWEKSIGGPIYSVLKAYTFT